MDSRRTFTHGAGCARLSVVTITYSRPSAREAAQSVVQKQIRAASNATACSGLGQVIAPLTSGAIAGSRGARRRTWSASVPRRSVKIARATDCSSVRSSALICSAARTKMPPGRSITLASIPAAISPMIWSCSTLPVAAALLVPDHEIDPQPLEAPVRMRLHELAHQLDVVRDRDLQQHDGKVAGDRIAPQPRLAAAVARDHGALRRAALHWRRDRARQPAVELRIGFGDVELAQHDLAVRPRHLERAIGEPPVLVLLHQGEACGAILADAGHEIDGHRLLGLEADALADRDDRIEHRSLRPGQRTASLRSACGSATLLPRPMKRARSVSYDASPTGAAVHGHADASMLGAVRRGARGRRVHRIARRACDDLGLHEQIGKRGWSASAAGEVSTTSA